MTGGGFLAFETAFPDNTACWLFLENYRWPNGPTCPDCTSVDEAVPSEGRLHRWRCRCGTRFHAAQGTAMEGTHLPLITWFAAIHLLAAAPGLPPPRVASALRLRRGTAPSLCHRVQRLASEDAALHRAIVRESMAGGAGTGRHGMRRRATGGSRT